VIYPECTLLWPLAFPERFPLTRRTCKDVSKGGQFVIIAWSFTRFTLRRLLMTSTILGRLGHRSQDSLIIDPSIAIPMTFVL
jgi:hypothetical protein